MKKITLYTFLLSIGCMLNLSCNSTNKPKKAITNQLITTSKSSKMDTSEIKKTEAEWKQLLTDEEYYVLRQAGTERPFTGKYTDTDDKGNYYCKACGNLLFTSETKYHSGCGWPAFYDKAGNSAVETKMDYSHGMTRVEVVCKKCKSHLGHVFEDGPRDKTGLRYCINSISLDFKEDNEPEK